MVNLYISEICDIFETEVENLMVQLKQAMEANYSHEQMTPLNNIMNGSKIIYNNLKDQLNNDITRIPN